MKSIKLIFLLFMLFSHSVLSANVPKQISIHYDLSKNGDVMMVATEKFEHDGKNYNIVSEGRGKGLYGVMMPGVLRRKSSGFIQQGLFPNEFSDQRGDRVPATAKFNWDKKTVTQQYKGEPEEKTLPASTHDRLSFLYNFAFQPLPSKDIQVTVADGKGLSQFHYTVQGKAMLDTPLGNIETVHLIKKLENKDDKSTEIWFAPKYHFLPVRILIVEPDGTRLDQVATKINIKN